MSHDPAHLPLPPAQRVAQRIFTALERFLHVEAVSGVALLIGAATAMIWANSPAAAAYHAFWNAPLSIGLGALVIEGTTHYVVNEVLMTIFFLVVGMEIRREMHEGALSSPRAATLPLAAALGGVVVPAMIYLTLNHEPALHAGWAVPTATDIAFAVGVLALLGRSIPGTVRILLLALAIVDDIAAVLIIALFYSGGIGLGGLLVAMGGVLLVLGLHRIGVGAAYAYVVPGALVWFGLHEAGLHPTLAGVALGLLTPARPMRPLEKSIEITMAALKDLGRHPLPTPIGLRGSEEAFRRLSETQRELLPPLIRVQAALHPWVAFGVMPLFALANAGVELGGIDLAHPDARSVIVGVSLALLVGKPIGIFGASWIAVRLGWCVLPPQATWRGVLLVGLLGGIGFTMSIFIAGLGFRDPELLSAAKVGVLLASVSAAIVGLSYGYLFVRRPRR